MNTFGERLKDARLKKNMKQTEVAASIDSTSTSISGWENNNTKPDLDKIPLLCEVLGVTPTYLICGSEEIFKATPDEQAHIQKYRVCDQRGQDMVDNVLEYEYNRSINPVSDKRVESYINVRVHYQAAAAGMNNYLTDDGYEEISFPSDVVPRGTDYGVRIAGDSMSPTIPSGSIVFVKAMPAIESGQVGIFYLNGEGFCKRLVVDHEQMSIRLESDNEKYKAMKISSDDDLRTYGEVLGYWVKK